tara:strand:+ start:144 stop:1901 length:1758 start_codon:yes stop_codon:yes gene_type:complete
MRILKSLSKILIIFSLIFIQELNHKLFSNEPVDIWNLEKKEKKDESGTLDDETIEDENNNIIKIKKVNKEENQIIKDDKLLSNNITLVGLFDPEENGLTIDMWKNSNGKLIKDLFDKINNKNISKDANEILEVALLTNSYSPTKNISQEEFFKYKNKYLEKKNDLNLIREFLIKNKDEIENPELIKYYINEHLSKSDLKKACSIFDEVNIIYQDNYLSKFKIYCLINDNKNEEAQLLFDLKKEVGFSDKFFEIKFNHLMGYENQKENDISVKNILDFHLSHRTSENFKYEPDDNTPNIIWKYLSSSNLLENVSLVDLEDENKIRIIEKATNDNNYNEDELLSLYKRFQFNIDQLLTAKNAYKLMPSFQGRALLYQKLLLTMDSDEKLKISFLLKESFEKDDISDAFTENLSNILSEIEKENVPSDLTTFYEANLISEDVKSNKIKFNNKIIHQSKLLNYFLQKYDIFKVEKETNDLLKKIKKDKKYVFSTKDLILLESLKSDGVNISNKYENLYEPNVDIPYDVQLLIKNGETGMVLLRLVEIIGEDELTDIGTETLNLIVSVLNLTNMDNIRNKILLKILPLKV